jgi:hypothetical protein
MDQADLNRPCRLGVEPAKPFIKDQSRRNSIGGRKGAATIGPPAITSAPASGAALTNQLFGASVAAGAGLCGWRAEALALRAASRPWRRVWRLCDPLVA